MPFAKVPARNLVVVVPQDDPASRASEAAWVKLVPILRLEILALDAAIARAAERVVEAVVVELAVGEVIEDVEFGRGEGCAAGAAGEALFVVAAGEAAGGVLDGFADDGEVAAAAFGAGTIGRAAGRGRG